MLQNCQLIFTFAMFIWISMVKVSIVIPVYNVARYILRCLESVVLQEKGSFKIECVLVDDCSPDDSMEIAKRFVDEYNGSVVFSFLRHDINKGQSAARNTGIRNATGDYLFFLDSDDRLEENALSMMIDATNQYPDVDYVDGYYLFMKDGNIYPSREKFYFFSENKKILDLLYKRKLSGLACNKLLRKKLIVDHSLYFVEGIIFEDIQWTNRLIRHVSSAVIIPNITYIYEYNPSSTSNTSVVNASKSINSFSSVIESFLDSGDDAVYVSHKMFVFHYIIMALDIQNKGKVDDFINKRFLAVKKRLFLTVLKDCRFVLVFFFLLMYKPFSFFFHFTFFRHHFHEMEYAVTYIAEKMNWVHKNGEV